MSCLETCLVNVGPAKCPEFQCPNGGPCVSFKYRCNGVNDCNDTAPGSDELNCSKLVLLKFETRLAVVISSDITTFCPESHFLCKNNRCILDIFYCDRDDDCYDNSDEPADCSKH